MNGCLLLGTALLGCSLACFVVELCLSKTGGSAIAACMKAMLFIAGVVCCLIGTALALA